jgi:hypothetical protein
VSSYYSYSRNQDTGYHLSPTRKPLRSVVISSSQEPRAQQALRLAAASLNRQTTPTVETTKEKATIKTSRRMGKNGTLGKKSQLALAAKKCRPIKDYFVRNISTTSAKETPEVFV